MMGINVVKILLLTHVCLLPIAAEIGGKRPAGEINGCTAGPITWLTSGGSSSWGRGEGSQSESVELLPLINTLSICFSYACAIRSNRETLQIMKLRKILSVSEGALVAYVPFTYLLFPLKSLLVFSKPNL